jgi:hypothetical protein
VSDPSVTQLIDSLFRNLLDNVRRNKLAASLAVIALLVTTTFALNSEYDERDRYRRVILPDIQRAETQFTQRIDDSKNAVNELWRLHYFLTAHNSAKDVLSLAKSRRPRTRAGKQAHNELIRYYELATEELAIIRTEMSIDESFDYLSAWEHESKVIQPIHDRWTRWINLSPNPALIDNPKR